MLESSTCSIAPSTPMPTPLLLRMSQLSITNTAPACVVVIACCEYMRLVLQVHALFGLGRRLPLQMLCADRCCCVTCSQRSGTQHTAHVSALAPTCASTQ